MLMLILMLSQQPRGCCSPIITLLALPSDAFAAGGRSGIAGVRSHTICTTTCLLAALRYLSCRAVRTPQVGAPLPNKRLLVVRLQAAWPQVPQRPDGCVRGHGGLQGGGGGAWRQGRQGLQAIPAHDAREHGARAPLAATAVHQHRAPRQHHPLHLAHDVLHLVHAWWEVVGHRYEKVDHPGARKPGRRQGRLLCQCDHQPHSQLGQGAHLSPGLGGARTHDLARDEPRGVPGKSDVLPHTVHRHAGHGVAAARVDGGGGCGGEIRGPGCTR
mmetsp:Transcript_20543/g.52152  ORF Transcript_20543/g.52152 Transcript_20543/m.52152 type:complete len:272 (-) Transcript_20543:830-1645(-)